MSTDIVPIEVLKARMEKYYKRARQSQQRGAYWNERWIKALFPEKEKEPEFKFEVEVYEDNQA